MQALLNLGIHNRKLRLYNTIILKRIHVWLENRLWKPHNPNKCQFSRVCSKFHASRGGLRASRARSLHPYSDKIPNMCTHFRWWGQRFVQWMWDRLTSCCNGPGLANRRRKDYRCRFGVCNASDDLHNITGGCLLCKVAEEQSSPTWHGSRRLSNWRFSHPNGCNKS